MFKLCKILISCPLRQNAGSVGPFSSCSVLCKSTEISKPAIDLEMELDADLEREKEIEMKRNKHRLPERVHKIFVLKETPTPEMKFMFTMKKLRQHYGQYGESSGLNPGILWPTKAELEDLIEQDKVFHPPLHETVAKLKAAELETQRQRQEYEETVEKNMVKHEKWLKDYHDKIQKKEQAAEEARIKRQQLIEEISEYLGYNVDPKDPKFKEAVQAKETEKKKERRKKKQDDSYKHMLEKLAVMAEKEERSDTT